MYDLILNIHYWYILALLWGCGLDNIVLGSIGKWIAQVVDRSISVPVCMSRSTIHCYVLGYLMLQEWTTAHTVLIHILSYIMVQGDVKEEYATTYIKYCTHITHKIQEGMQANKLKRKAWRLFVIQHNKLMWRHRVEIWYAFQFHPQKWE